MSQLVHACPDLYNLIMHSVHLDHQQHPFSVSLDFQESSSLLPTGPLDLSTDDESYHLEERSTTDLPTQPHSQVPEVACRAEMPSAQIKCNSDVASTCVASAKSPIFRDKCVDCTLAGSFSLPTIAPKEVFAVNAPIADPSPNRSSLDEVSREIYLPISSHCFSSSVYMSATDVASACNVSCRNDMFGWETEGLGTESADERSNGCETMDKTLGPSPWTSAKGQVENDEGLKNLTIDLSWLDDDDQFERDRVRRLVGEHIQILPPGEGRWQDALVTAELCDGSHIVIYADGGVQEVKLNSLLWRKSL